MKLKKRRKSSRFRGSHTHGRGFKKKARGSGHRGGVGMAGTGKRADQKKTLVLNLYGNKYFKRDKALRMGTIKKKLKSINLKDIKQDKDYTGYKILAQGDAPAKLKIKASAASKQAIEKIKKAQGEIVILDKEE